MAGLASLPVAPRGDCAIRTRQRRAELLQQFINDNPQHWETLGIKDPHRNSPAEHIAIESIRAIQRIGPDGQLIVHYVVEVLAWQWVDELGWFPGGSTLIIDPVGTLRYLIHKRIRSKERQQRTRHFLLGNGLRYAGVLANGRGPTAVVADAARLLLSLHTRCC